MTGSHDAWVDEFLIDREPEPWDVGKDVPGTLRPRSYFLGRGTHPLEVVLATAAGRPKADDVRRLWKLRHGGRPSPVLLVVGYPGHDGPCFSVCGPAGEHPTLLHDLPLSQTERLADAALAEPNRHAAIRFLVSMMPEVESDLPGLRNTGLLANQELRNGVPLRPDWADATHRGQQLLPLSGHRLVEALGFQVGSLSVSSSVLSIGAGNQRAVAVFLDETESFEESAERFQGVSPVSHALAIAEQENLPWVVLTRGRQIRLYSARPAVGVGRKGQAETYVEANLALLPADAAGYVPLLFGAGALVEKGTLEEILERSEDFAADLAARLRERVYHDTVPTLARAVAARLGDPAELDDSDLSFAYEQTLLILFRLLFVAYGEDKELLPYRSNSMYADHSLKRVARLLAERVRSGTLAFDANATDLWEDINQLWRAVHSGNAGWGLPAYNGGMFSGHAEDSRAGSALSEIALTDDEFGPALVAMLIDTGDDDVIGPVDFRSLSVTEFGTIYEGLLESMLSIAPTDLVTDDRGTYVPAKGKQTPVVHAGEIYFHNRSGARKATGSYFTKHFAVEHLLDHALEPALDDHLERISELLDADDQAAAADRFFDFRCVDLAMGSGHFLVAAVDRIERRLSNYLSIRPIPSVTAELHTLRQAALDALGDLSHGVEIETRSLLRRQVARRCVYGVDLNPISVELARLALWIHTFVPGLPLSFLNHSLVVGNALTGIGTLDEALDILDPDLPSGQVSLFREGIEEFLGRARGALTRLARTTEATTTDVKAAREAHLEATEAVEPARQLFDLLVSARLGRAQRPIDVSESSISNAADLAGAEEFAREIQALHFPIAFPEVFLRERPGFDCVLGNPPWDKVRYEAQQFWVVRDPGLNSLPAKEREARIDWLRLNLPDDAILEEKERALRAGFQTLFSAAFNLQGRGHLELAKLFVERALEAKSGDGRLGLVLPGNSLVVGGWAKLREQLVRSGSMKLVEARNARGWLFDDLDFRYAVVLLSRGAACNSGSVGVWPAVDSGVRFAEMGVEPPIVLNEHEISSLSDRWAIPWFATAEDQATFDSMRERPSLASGAGWVTGRSDSALWDFSGSGRHAAFASSRGTGESWAVLMTRHVRQFGIAPDVPFQRFIRKPAELVSLGRGVELNDDGGPPQLSPDHPRVVYRYPARNDDSRTLIAAVLPDAGFLPSTGYVHSIVTDPRSPQIAAALVAYLNSFVCDWWVRRFVDRHVTAPIINALPMPAWTDEEVLAAAELCRGLSDVVHSGAPSRGGFGDPDLAWELRADLEHLVGSSFGLSAKSMAALLADFSEGDAACPPGLRRTILQRFEEQP
jgi:hypothetical protein